MAFDLGEFESLSADIEKYLGWLKGNELVADYEVKLRSHVWNAENDGPTAPVWYRTEPSDEDLGVLFANTIAPSLRHNEIKDEMKKAFESGANWASGTGDYLKSLVIHVVRPDAGALHESVVAFQQAGDQLESILASDWTDLDVNSWNGLSSDAFQDTIEEFNSTISDQYLRYWAHSQTLYAAACAIIVQVQSGLIPFLSAVKKGLHDQLVNWAQTGGMSSITIDPKIVDALKVGRTVIGLVPVVGKVDKYASLTGDILGLLTEDPPKLPADFEVQTSDSIYIDLTTTLTDDFARGAQSSLDALRSERSLSIRNAQEAITPWFTPRFPGASDEPWTHDAEG